MKKVLRKRIHTIWRFGKPYWPLFIVAEICILVFYTVALLLPLNLTRLTDEVLYGENTALLPVVIRDYGILFAVMTVFNLIYAYVWQTLQNRYVVGIKNAMFEKTMFAKASFLAGMNSGDIMSRIDTDADQFLHVIQRNLFHFCNSFLLCAGIIYMVAQINGTIAVMLIAAAALPIVITRLCGKLTEKYSRGAREITGVYTGRVYEILKNMRELRLLCAKWWADSQVLEPLKKIIRLGNQARRVDFAVNKLVYLMNLAASLIVYGFSVRLALSMELSVGMFLAIIQYIALLHKKFNWMLRIYLDWYARKISIDRVNEILDCESEEQNGEPIDSIEDICFRDVSFSYEPDGSHQVLHQIAFNIRKGERVAVAGASGTGKTTIMGLLTRLYDPTSGEILVNGRPIQEWSIRDLRGQIGIVSQDIQLFDETIRYNLQMGGGYSEEALWHALDKVGLKALVENLPDGLETRIGSAAYGLSGGQKQRLMIARMLLKRVSLIILDEATSALDVDSEQRIADMLGCLGGDVTMIVISHRLAAVRECGKVIVIRDGRVESIGTHQELMRSSVSYNRLFGEDAA